MSTARAARVLVAGVDRPSALLHRLVRLPVTSVVSATLFGGLADELGGPPAAILWLVEQAAAIGRPILVNLSTPEGSATISLSPPGWSQERLDGWTAGQVEHLEELFGPAELRRMP